MPADLHCHTRYSDGAVTVEELVALAKINQVPAIALTDHDTVAGWEEAEQFGRQYGVTVIPGVELSGYDGKRKQKAHILCYFCPHPEGLQWIFDEVAENRRIATDEMIQLALQRYPIPREMIVRRAGGEGRSIYKQHILHALSDAGYTKQLFGELYRELFDYETGLAHREIPYPDVYDVLKSVRETGGVAVFAHPGEYKKEGLLEELAASGLIDGVEVWHPKNPERKRPDYQRVAQQYGLFQTGGTDFHGMYSARYGSVGSFVTPDSQLARLMQCKEKYQR